MADIQAEKVALAAKRIDPRGNSTASCAVDVGQSASIQRMVDADYSGVLFTRDPSAGHRAIFGEFQGASSTPDDVQGSGDVKYHLGSSSDREFDGNKVHLSLTANPSHLEAVDPRHQPVAHHHADRLGLQPLPGGFAVHGLDAVVTQAPQRLPQYRQRHGVVFDGEDLHAGQKDRFPAALRVPLHA